LEISARVEMPMRRHHEELSILPALSLLLPFAGALWLRIKTGRQEKTTEPREGRVKAEGDV
jgi:hypothetical protein